MVELNSCSKSGQKSEILILVLWVGLEPQEAYFKTKIAAVLEAIKKLPDWAGFRRNRFPQLIGSSNKWDPLHQPSLDVDKVPVIRRWCKSDEPIGCR